jgi:hypothetical protein
MFHEHSTYKTSIDGLLYIIFITILCFFVATFYEHKTSNIIMCEVKEKAADVD